MGMYYSDQISRSPDNDKQDISRYIYAKLTLFCDYRSLDCFVQSAVRQCKDESPRNCVAYVTSDTNEVILWSTEHTAHIHSKRALYASCHLLAKMRTEVSCVSMRPLIW